MKFQHFTARSSAAQVDTVVIPEKLNAQILLKRLDVYAAHANDIVKFYKARGYGRTTNSAAVAASGTTIILDGDAGVKNTLSGIAVAANDFLLVQSNAGWKLNLIAGVNAGGADGKITINSITFYDGGSNFGSIVAEDAICYIIWAEDVAQLAVGAVSTATPQLYTNLFAGEDSQPVAVSHVGGSAALHYTNGVAEYVGQGDVPKD